MQNQTCYYTTPFQALYDKPPPTLVRYTHFPNGDVMIHQQLSERDILLAQLKHNLLKDHQAMKVQVDKHMKVIQLEVGDTVFVKL